MYATINGNQCPVVLAGREALVLHPRYHALRAEPLEPEVGIYVLHPVASADRSAFEADGGAGILVAWVGDVMEQVDVDVLIEVDIEAAARGS